MHPSTMYYDLAAEFLVRALEAIGVQLHVLLVAMLSPGVCWPKGIEVGLYKYYLAPNPMTTQCCHTIELTDAPQWLCWYS